MASARASIPRNPSCALVPLVLVAVAQSQVKHRRRAVPELGRERRREEVGVARVLLLTLPPAPPVPGTESGWGWAVDTSTRHEAPLRLLPRTTMSLRDPPLPAKLLAIRAGSPREPAYRSVSSTVNARALTWPFHSSPRPPAWPSPPPLPWPPRFLATPRSTPQDGRLSTIPSSTRGS